jgi:hypothetical protein
LTCRSNGSLRDLTAFVKLNDVLSDDQKKTAGELLAPHMGMGMMAMMPAPAPPDQKEQGRMSGMGMGKK